MKIGFIGAGKVGSAFGHYLRSKGLEVAGYCSKSQESAVSAAKFTDSNYYDLNSLVENCDYIFITTPDDAISEVWGNLKSFNLQDKKIFHMSGSMSSLVFEDIDGLGAFGYSLHPLFPFTDRNSYRGLDTAVFTIEGKKIEAIKGFLDMSGINYFEIKDENKTKYHAAAVFASNYIVALSKISKTLLLECGIPEKDIGRALYPLMLGVVDNINDGPVESALTGPLVRGDVGTIKKHREILGEFRTVYDELGRIALGIVSGNGNLPDSKIMEMNNVLGGNDNEKNSSNL